MNQSSGKHDFHLCTDLWTTWHLCFWVWKVMGWHVPLQGWAANTGCWETPASSASFAGVFPSLCKPDQLSHEPWLSLYYNVMQLTDPAWEQLSVLLTAAIWYGQSDSWLSETLHLDPLPLFHFSNYVDDRKQKIVINMLDLILLETGAFAWGLAILSC